MAKVTLCTKCYREYNPCSVRVCPKSGAVICRYCCMKCPESYRAAIGNGCRVVDERRKIK